jgi:CHAT domain-containing protein
MWEMVKEKEGVRMEMRREERRVTGMLPGLLSGIVCAGANQPAGTQQEDGLLTAEEITWLDLSGVSLVVLSACETGLGSPRGGEGMIGLRRSLRQAGVNTVISSLWNVRDVSTSELMRNFYQRLWLKGESKLDALRNAQLDMLKQNRIKYKGNGLPATWGAFVLDGDWR